VAGLLRPMHKLNNLNTDEPSSPWIFKGKGKSLGKKPATSLRDK
jgi:hypothetical protein